MDMSEKLKGLKSLRDFETAAMEEMSETAKLYFSAEASDPWTSRHNEKAFSRFRICPRILRDVSEANLNCKILGASAPCPIGLSPTGIQSLVHEEAEEASAAGCCGEGCVFILSSISSKSIEEVRAKVDNLFQKGEKPVLWMQVYMHRNRSETIDLVRRAELSGFSAIVVTVDSPNCGLWRRTMPDSFFKDVAQRFSNVSCVPRLFVDASLTFEDLKWLTGITRLPVVVKGILNGRDAEEAVKCGARAILVSNHGGRLIEKVVASIDVLSEIVHSVKNADVDVYLDGGVRSGSDVFIALALGAKAVFIGRPAIWGLSVGGEDGVKKVLEILKEETLQTMQLAGAKRVEDVEESMVVKEPLINMLNFHC